MLVQKLVSGVILGIGLAAGEYLGKRIIRQMKEKKDETTAGSEQLHGDHYAAAVRSTQCESAGSEGPAPAQAQNQVGTAGAGSLPLAEPSAPVPVVRSA